MNFIRINWLISFFVREGKPSARMVLLKDFDDKGLVFFTNYNSKKGQELAANPQASLVFYWDVISRQVRFDGRVVKISREESESYFTKRPLNSRISAYISDQSKVIESREVNIPFENSNNVTECNRVNLNTI